MRSMQWAWLWLGVAAVGVSSQYSNNAIKLRERMKLISGGVNPSLTRPTAAPVSDNTPYKDIIYTDPKLDGPYESDTSFNARGMGQLYSVTNMFLGWILPSRAYPESMIQVSGTNVKFGDITENYQEWIQFYSGPLAVLAVGLAFAILLPIVGLFFCCCRCAGKCGARSRLEKRHDSCKRGFYFAFLFAVSVILLFGVVCVYVTNEQVQEGTGGIIDAARTGLKDADLFLKNTGTEIDHLLVDNYNELRQQLDNLLGNSSDIIGEALEKSSHASILGNLTQLASSLEVVKTDLQFVRNGTLELQAWATELSESLDQTRDELLRELNACRSEPACAELLRSPQIRELRVLQNFSELPDVGSSFASISDIINDDSLDGIQEQIKEGKQSLQSIRTEVRRAVEEHSPQLERTLDDTGKKLKEAADNIKGGINEARNLLNKLQGKNLDQAQEYIEEYHVYRYYLGLAMSSSLLLVLLCLTFGLLCGFCGRRPEDLYADHVEACSKVSGARFLMVALWMIFLLGSVLMILTMALFAVGFVGVIGVCRPLADPANDQIFALVEDFIDYDDLYNGKHVDINTSQIITSCHENKTVYMALKLENRLNIDEVLGYQALYRVDETVAQFKSKLVIKTDSIQLLSNSGRRRLTDLTRSPVNDIQFNKFSDQLSSSLTNINLVELSQKLKAHADRIPAHSRSGYVTNVPRLLRTKAQFLELLQQSYVVRIQSGVAALKVNVTALKRHLQFGDNNLRNTITNIIRELDEAQRYLSSNGSIHLKLLANDFTDEYEEYVDEYLHRVVNKTKLDVARCGVVSNVYNATRVAACNRIVDPFNGFWASMGWCTLLFILILFLCVKLSSLYNKSDLYTAHGTYPETEYLYDAYADRESVPLSTHADKKSKHRSYENGAGNMQDYSAHLSRSERSNTAEARFSDMAPKQWDARSPPRYGQPPATEYERPPPYYYPGPGERN